MPEPGRACCITVWQGQQQLAHMMRAVQRARLDHSLLQQVCSRLSVEFTPTETADLWAQALRKAAAVPQLREALLVAAQAVLARMHHALDSHSAKPAAGFAAQAQRNGSLPHGPGLRGNVPGSSGADSINGSDHVSRGSWGGSTCDWLASLLPTHAAEVQGLSQQQKDMLHVRCPSLA